MWALENNTPYQADRAFVRDKNGAEVWVIAVRATFSIKPDETLELAEQQIPVAQVPKYAGNAGSSSLLYDTDLVLWKPTTDVLLHGHAYAPRNKPVTEMRVAIKVASIEKTLKVVGDRYWQKPAVSPLLTDPAPFVEMPITYEHAYGGKHENTEDPDEQGFEPRNPVGTGFYVKKKQLLDKRAPNILSSYKATEPAGFGPIANNWQPRSKYAGTYDQQWENSRYPLLPLDFDERFCQCAPQDQQTLKHLRGGEEVLLANLTPEGRMRFCLPMVRLIFRTEFNVDFVEHRAVLHTVIFEPDMRRVQMVWHTNLHCHTKIYKLRRTIIYTKEVIRLSSLGTRASKLNGDT